MDTDAVRGVASVVSFDCFLSEIQSKTSAESKLRGGGRYWRYRVENE